MLESRILFPPCGYDALARASDISRKKKQNFAGF